MVLRIVIILSFSTELFAGNGLVINEIMAVNNCFITDDFGDYDDWIELYNSSENEVTVDGLYLSDNKDKLDKFRITLPDTIEKKLKPKSYIIIWADDEINQGALHCTFKLKGKGEQLFLVGNDGTTVLDSVTFSGQMGDISFGRYPDGHFSWVYHKAPSPDGENLPEREECIPPPAFSKAAGFYGNDLVVELAVPCGKCSIYYTTDGSDPATENGLKYSKPILIPSTTVLRARTCRSDLQSSDIVTKTYFINEQISLPVVSLVTNPPNLWDWETGIYVKGDGAQEKNPYWGANFHKDWEKSGHFEFFDRKNNGYEHSGILLKIAGGWSRAKDKKSFKISSYSKNGKSYFSYPFFKDKNIRKLKKLFLRADAAGGWHIKNELIYKLNKLSNSNVAIQSYTPTVLFLNGEYWGIYNLMETKGKEFIETNFGYSDVDIISSYSKVIEGDSHAYDSLCKYLNTIDISMEHEYQEIEKRIDIQNCIDYWFYEIYTGKGDNNVNIRYWKARQSGAKWKWISFDMDWWKYENNLERLTRDTIAKGYLILGSLLRNPTFRNKFIIRFCDLMNFTFKEKSVQKTIVEICDAIRCEMPRENRRWSAKSWDECISWLNTFSEQRPDQCRSFLKKKFSLGDMYTITCKISDQARGTVRVNSFTINSSGVWNGTYFKGFPVTLAAIPKKGYIFEGWGDNQLSGDSALIELTPLQSLSLQPIFRSTDPYYNRNEIPGKFLISTLSKKGIVSIVISNEKSFQLYVNLEIFDLKGKPVRSFISNKYVTNSKNTIHWKGKNNSGDFVTNGLYLIRISGKGRGTSTESNFLHTTALLFRR